MQTGAFLQLILTMSAIISRMDSQLSELRPAAEEFSSALRRVAAVIGVRLCTHMDKRKLTDDRFLPRQANEGQTFPEN